MEHHKRIQCFSAQLSAEHEETTGRSDRANDFFKKYARPATRSRLRRVAVWLGPCRTQAPITLEQKPMHCGLRTRETRSPTPYLVGKAENKFGISGRAFHFAHAAATRQHTGRTEAKAPPHHTLGVVPDRGCSMEAKHAHPHLPASHISVEHGHARAKGK